MALTTQRRHLACPAFMGLSQPTASRTAQLERGDGVVEGIDPVLASCLGMVVHPSDELSRRVSGRKSRGAPAQKAAVTQKFDISKDLLLARFGSSLAVHQKFGRGDLGGHGRQRRERKADTGGPAHDLASGQDCPRAHLTLDNLRAAALLAVIPFLVAGKPVVSQQTICDVVQSYVNTLVDYTRTACRSCRREQRHFHLPGRVERTELLGQGAKESLAHRSGSLPRQRHERSARRQSRR